MSKLNKVVIVGPLAPPAGGMANQTLKLAEFLRSEGLVVDIVRTNADYKPAFIGKLPVIRSFFRLVAYKLSLFKQLKSADVVHVMANSGWSWHLFAAPAIAIARILNKPVVLNYRGGYAQSFFEKSWFWVNLTLNRVQAIVVPSTFLQQVFKEFSKTAQVVPNVLDQHLFYPTKIKPNINAPHFIVTRNLEAIYDVATVINAFARIKKEFPQAHLSIAGTGPELISLEKQVINLKLEKSIVFTGRLSAEQMAQLYQNANVMLNASTVDNTPNSIIESLACGTPVVTTNAGGISKLVTHQHDALLIEIGDDKNMAEQAISLLKNEEQRVALIDNGLNTITKFYWPNVWLNLKACYDSVLANKR
ncbi:MAG: glycosyltransferase [Colwellia sp.]|nr:glycosyltransferase [Colwellia sp.]